MDVPVSLVAPPFTHAGTHPSPRARGGSHGTQRLAAGCLPPVGRLAHKLALSNEPRQRREYSSVPTLSPQGVARVDRLPGYGPTGADRTVLTMSSMMRKGPARCQCNDHATNGKGSRATVFPFFHVQCCSTDNGDRTQKGHKTLTPTVADYLWQEHGKRN